MKLSSRIGRTTADSTAGYPLSRGYAASQCSLLSHPAFRIHLLSRRTFSQPVQGPSGGISLRTKEEGTSTGKSGVSFIHWISDRPVLMLLPRLLRTELLQADWEQERSHRLKVPGQGFCSFSRAEGNEVPGVALQGPAVPAGLFITRHEKRRPRPAFSVLTSPAPVDAVWSSRPPGTSTVTLSSTGGSLHSPRGSLQEQNAWEKPPSREEQ